MSQRSIALGRHLATPLVAGLMAALIATPAHARDEVAPSNPVTDHEAMLWLEHQRLAFGLGHGPLLRPGRSTPNLGLGFRLSPSTTLTWETDTRALPATASDLSAPHQRLGLGFEHRRADGDLKGIFRVQLGSQAVLQWRPRKDGLRVSYRATF